jgi:hypothetical protein
VDIHGLDQVEGFSKTMDGQQCAWNHSQSEFMVEATELGSESLLYWRRHYAKIDNLASPADMMGCFSSPQTLHV